MQLNNKGILKPLEPISEDGMISIFLKGEATSERFKQEISSSLTKRGLDISILQKPNIQDRVENEARRETLEDSREYISRKGLFKGLPEDIKWYRAEVTSEFLLEDVLYINYSYWVELTSGTRQPMDTVERIAQDERVFDVPFDGFTDAAKYFKDGGTFEELIIVSDKKKFVVMEGHLRLTAYALNKEILPESFSVILGVSESMGDWRLF